MAVQAHHLHPNSTTIDEATNLQYLLYHPPSRATPTIHPSKLFSGPQSELSDLPSASRKRCRAMTGNIESTATSTSGRAFDPSLNTPLSHQLYQHNLDIDNLVRLHNEKLRQGVEEIRKRQCHALLSTIEQQASKRLRQKEMELQALARHNSELQQKIRQLAGEKEAWMSVAKNNEAIVAGLHSTIEQLLLQNTAAAPVGAGDDVAPVFSAEDAESCCFEPAPAGNGGRSCRACGGADVCVLVLPCRHLCLCKECESEVDTCPVCMSGKNASLQVFMA